MADFSGRGGVLAPTGRDGDVAPTGISPVLLGALRSEQPNQSGGHMNRTHRYPVLAAVLGSALIGAAILSAAEKSNSAQAFDRLASLVGQWKAVQGNTEIKLTYTLTANGSVLMEQCQPAGDAEMITMYTVDGDHLIATHYCSAGNQPQMATKPITEASAKNLTFSLLRVTGLKTPEAFHNRSEEHTSELQSRF